MAQYIQWALRSSHLAFSGHRSTYERSSVVEGGIVALVTDGVWEVELEVCSVTVILAFTPGWDNVVLPGSASSENISYFYKTTKNFKHKTV